jgi:hypothetical protein
VEDFVEPLVNQLKRLAPEDEGAKLPLEFEIVQDLQNPEISNAIVGLACGSRTGSTVNS